jgi:hypothetical protein
MLLSKEQIRDQQKYVQFRLQTVNGIRNKMALSIWNPTTTQDSCYIPEIWSVYDWSMRLPGTP